MNATDNEKDPFEEVFRNRFADFESEPNTELWNKIEPQLPVDSTRTMPYWQISTVIILLLLLGWGVYHNERPKEAKTSLASTPTEDISTKQSSISVVEKPSTLSVLALTLKQKSTIQDTKTNNEVIDKQIVSNEKTNISTIEKGAKLSIEKREPPTVYTKGSSSKIQNTANGNLDNNNIFIAENIQKNYQEIVEESSFTQANVPNETPHFSSVSYQENSISQEKKNPVTALNSKQYHLLNSQFKTPKLKPIVEPKEDEYYKESQPIDVYMSVMPLMNYYTITPEGNEANYVHNIVINNDADRLGFYTQAGAIFTLSEKFKLRTGLTFTKTNHSIDYRVRTDSLIVQSPNNKSADVSFAELDKTYSQIANYLGAKVELQYILFKSDPLTHYVNVGLEGAYRLNGNQQFNGFANIAYGVTRQIGRNVYLFVEPTFSYSLNQQSDKNSFLLVKPNKIGFNIGVNFRIR
jgi:hypothetical protein